MKKIVVSFVLSAILIISGFVFSACAKMQETDKILIYTSFYPIYDFASKVGGEKVEVVNLVKPEEEVHGYEPTAQDMVGMENADLIIINGLNMEGWVGDISTSLTQKLVDTSANVQTITVFEQDDAQHEHGTLDPHIWTSIRNAKIQMENIKNALIEIDPENAEYYQINYTRYTFMFDGLDNQYTQVLSQASTTNFVVSHRAFSYLANDYNLTQHSLTGIIDTGEPDAQTLATIISFINQNNIHAIFYHDNQSKQVAESIIADTQVSIYPLSTLSYLTEEEANNNEDYFSIMSRNLVYLELALA